MDNKPCPAPLSADSLRETSQIIDELELLQDCKDFVIRAIELHTKHTEGGYEAYHDKIEKLGLELSEFIATALQSERQRIADSLPKPREAGARDIGQDAAIEAVRAVLIPPTGGSVKPSELAEQGDTKSITGASASEEER